MTASARLDRQAVVRRGQRLTWATIAYNSLEAILALAAGLMAGSVALVGFGFDSVIELSSSVAGLWRLHSDASMADRERSERRCASGHRVLFLAAGGLRPCRCCSALWLPGSARRSPCRYLIAGGSWSSRHFGESRTSRGSAMTSRALTAEARQTELCWYLSLILLAGLVLNAVWGGGGRTDAGMAWFSDHV